MGVRLVVVNGMIGWVVVMVEMVVIVEMAEVVGVANKVGAEGESSDGCSGDSRNGWYVRVLPLRKPSKPAQHFFVEIFHGSLQFSETLLHMFQLVSKSVERFQSQCQQMKGYCRLKSWYAYQ